MCAVSAGTRSAAVLISTRHSCSVWTLPSQRYTLVIGPTTWAQAPSLASITPAARALAASSLSVVETTMTGSEDIPKILREPLRDDRRSPAPALDAQPAAAIPPELKGHRTVLGHPLRPVDQHVFQQA